MEGTNAWLVARADLIHEVVADPDRFSSRTNEFLYLGENGRPYLAPRGTGPPPGLRLAPVLATTDPPDHTRQRKVLHRVLSTKALNAREDEFRALIDAALERPLEAGRVEGMGEVAEPLPLVMVARLLGVPEGRRSELRRYGYAAMELIGGFVSPVRRAELVGILDRVGPDIAAMTVRAFEERDLSTALGACARAVVDGEMTREEALSVLGLLVTAGGESTTSLLGSCARILAQDEELQDRLRADPRLTDTFVEEVCRIEPPFRGHYRRVVADTTLGGVELPEGARLVLLWPAANRDEAVHDHPEMIDLHRHAPRRHMGFGAGIHLCIGAPLARLEARVTVQQLLARTSRVSLASSASGLRHHRSLMIRRLVELPLELAT